MKKRTYKDAINAVGDLSAVSEENTSDSPLGLSSLSEEEFYFLKFANLILRLVPRAFRVFFDKKFPPDQICSRLNQFKHKLFKLRNKNIINKFHWEQVMFPPTGNSLIKSTDFDLTLQFLLIKYLGNISIQDSLPDVADSSILSSVSTLAYYHQYITNTAKTTMTGVEFEKAWADVTKSVQKIAGTLPKEECDMFRKSELDSTYVDFLVKLIHVKRTMVENPNDVTDNVLERFIQICGKIENLKRKDFQAILYDVYELEESMTSHDNPVIKEKIAEWKAKDTTFVNTNASKRLLESVKRNQAVVVYGLAGIGKTFTSRHVALTLQQEGFEIFPISQLKDFTSCHHSETKRIFLIDNIFGQCNTVLFDFEQWEGYEESLRALLRNYKNAKLIFIVRSNIYKNVSVKCFFKALNAVEFDMSSDACALGHEEKRKIWNAYFKSSSFDLLEDVKSTIVNYFPLLCKLHNANKDTNADTMDLSFFTNPFQAVSTYMDNLYNTDEYCYLFLLFLVMLNNNITLKFLNDKGNTGFMTETFQLCFHTTTNFMPSFSKYIIYGIRKLKGFYIQDLKTGYRASHDKVFDLLCKYFGGKHIDCILKRGESDVIYNRVVFLSLGFGLDIEGAIFVRPEKESEYFERALSDIRKGKGWYVFSSIQMPNEKFRRQLIAYLSKNIQKTERHIYNDIDTLYVVCKLGYYDIVEFILTNVESREISKVVAVSGKTPLWAACYGGFQKIVELLLLRGFNVNQETLAEETSVYAACRTGQLNILEVLIKHLGDVDHPQRDGATPLYAACDRKHKQIIELLLKHGASVNKATKIGSTPLHIACFSDNTDLIDTLLGYKADTKKATNEGVTPLHIACYNGQKEVVDQLLVSYANVNQTMLGGVTPLYIACEMGHTSIVELLLTKYANINQATETGITPLYAASLNGHKEVVDLLQNERSDTYIRSKGFKQLYTACENGHFSIVDWLLRNNVGINEGNEYGITPLHIAAYKGNLQVVKLLLENKANVNIVSKNGVTPIYMACNNGYLDIVELFLKNGADVNLAAEYGHTPLYIACENGHTTVAALLLKHNADVNQTKSGGLTPLYIACRNGHTHVVHMLLDHYAYVNHAVDKGDSPLHIACNNGHTPIVELLLCYHASINQTMANGATPLYVASENGHESVVSCLLNNDANVNLCRSKGSTPLFVACAEGHEVVAKLLLNNHANVNQKREGGFTPLYIASRNGHVKILDLLLYHKADINITDDFGVTSLYIASEHNQMDVVEFLLQKKAAINVRNKQGYTPLHIACKNNYKEVVAVLLKYNASLSVGDDSGTTPLYLATSCGYMDIMDIIISSNLNHPDLNIETKEGFTPLFAACKKNDISTVKYLLDKGANINHKSVRGMAPLNIALDNGLFDMAEYLLKHGADVNTQDNVGMTPLFIACQGGKIDVIELLLKYQPNVNLATDKNITPLYIASFNGNDIAVGKLLDHNADVNICKVGNLSPLYVACYNGHTRVAEMLLKAKADVNHYTSEKITPLHVACDKNRDDLVNALLNYGALVVLENKDGLTAIDIVRRNGNSKLTEILEQKKTKIVI